MTQARITFAIPFYSTPEYLKCAIDSVVAQTIEDWTLIVVDDCSPAPGIKELVDSYQDQRISYHKNDENLGQAGNWNKCVELVNTELFTLLHADDQLLPEYSEIMLNAATQWPSATAFFCQTKIINGVGKEIFSFPDFVKKFIIPSTREAFCLSGEKGITAMLGGNFIMCPTLCYRKEKLLNEKFSRDWKCLPDMEYITRLFFQDATIVGLPQKGLAYRRHEDSGTANTIKDMTMFREEFKLFDILRSKASELQWEKAQAKAKQATIIKLRVLYFALYDFISLRISYGFRKLGLLLKVIIFPKLEGLGNQ